MSVQCPPVSTCRTPQMWSIAPPHPARTSRHRVPCSVVGSTAYTQEATHQKAAANVGKLQVREGSPLFQAASDIYNASASWPIPCSCGSSSKIWHEQPCEQERPQSIHLPAARELKPRGGLSTVHYTAPTMASTLTCHVLSKPSSVISRVPAIMPALFTSTARGLSHVDALINFVAAAGVDYLLNIYNQLFNI